MDSRDQDDPTYILLAPRSKKPIRSATGSHAYTSDREQIRRHLAGGGNLGVTAADRFILDFDDEGAHREMVDSISQHLQTTVWTGSGKTHVHFLGARPDLAGTIYWRGKVVGQIKRLPTEYCVVPPSTHPTTGARYQKVGNPYSPGEKESAVWLDFLLNHMAKHRPEPSGSETSGEFEIPDRIEDGERWSTFFRWTRSWKARGLTLGDALEIIELANETITHPPMDWAELEREVRRAWHQPDREDYRR